LASPFKKTLSAQALLLLKAQKPDAKLIRAAMQCGGVLKILRIKRCPLFRGALFAKCLA
jgi:hypothetical protein